MNEANADEGQATTERPVVPTRSLDRTGQCWRTHGVALLVLAAPARDVYGHVVHPCLLLDDPMDRWEPGKKTSMYENAFKRWEDQPHMQRIL